MTSAEGLRIHHGADENCPLTRMEPEGTSLTPAQYIAYALSPRCFPHLAGTETRVEGDVDLGSCDDGRAVKTLPDAVISGKLLADENTSLASIGACTVHGDTRLDHSGIQKINPAARFNGRFSAKGCKKLHSISGIYGGDVSLDRSGLRRAGSDFFCSMDLSLLGCNLLEELDCTVAGSVDAGFSGLRELGRGFRTGKHLFLSHCRNLREIGFVGDVESVSLDHSGIERIQEDFRCAKSLSLSSCPGLREIPDIATESIAISGCPIVSLRATKVSDYLSAENCHLLADIAANPATKVRLHACAISSIDGLGHGSKFTEVSQCPRLARVCGARSGSLHLHSMPGLTEVGGGFRCGGDLKISQCDALSSLRGEVGGDAHLMGLPSLNVLGGDFRCGGDLDVSHHSGGEGIVLACSVGGGLFVRHSSIRETGAGMNVSGDATFDHCESLRRIRGFVGGHIRVNESGVEAIGADFECEGSLCAIGCRRLRVLNCSVGGKVVVVGSSLEKTGPAFHCGKDAEFGGCRKLKNVGGRVDGRVRMDMRDAPAVRISGGLPNARSAGRGKAAGGGGKNIP